MKTIRHTADSLKLAHFASGLNGWHSFDRLKRTERAIDRAEMLGAIEVSRETRQFRPVVTLHDPRFALMPHLVNLP